MLVLALGLTCPAATRDNTGDTVEIQFLQTTDIHGFIDDSDALEGGGGWLRIATLIRRQRDAWGAARTVLLDCGDTCQGTLVAAVSKGAAAAELLQALEYDVWAPGNHELDFGVARYLALCQAVEGRVLCGNVSVTLDGERHAHPAWRMLERSRARIAVIGAGASYLKQWLWGRSLESYEVETAVSMLERVLPEILRARPDMIVLAIHQGWLEHDPRAVNEIRTIAWRFPEIDLIFGGHTHRPRPGMRLGHGTWYVQAGKHAAHLAVARATIDLRRHEVVRITSHLIAADAAVPVDREARRAAEPWLAKAAAFAREPVGTLTAAVSASGHPGEDCEISDLICQAIAAASGADVVLHGRLSAAGLPAGTVTEADLFSVIPYENSIATARLTAAELAEILTEQLAYRDSAAYNGIWGAAARTDAAGGVSVSPVAGADGAAPTRVKVAFNSYTVAGGGGRFPRLRALLRRPESKLLDLGVDSRDALRAFVRDNTPLRCTTRRWLDTDAAARRRMPVLPAPTTAAFAKFGVAGSRRIT